MPNPPLIVLIALGFSRAYLMFGAFKRLGWL